MKLIIHTPCLYTRLAIESLFSDFYSHIEGRFIILDSRKFKTISEIHGLAAFYTQNSENTRILIILNGKFVKAGREVLGCGVGIQESISRWGFIIKNIIINEMSLHNTLRCLTRYSSDQMLEGKALSVMRLISRGKKINDISSILKLKPKTVYVYISKLKAIFHQPTINHLYAFLEELNPSGESGDDNHNSELSPIKSQLHNSGQLSVKKLAEQRIV
jgi:DNA-binding CsgD family transcriptional regulator